VFASPDVWDEGAGLLALHVGLEQAGFADADPPIDAEAQDAQQDHPPVTSMGAGRDDDPPLPQLLPDSRMARERRTP